MADKKRKKRKQRKERDQERSERKLPEESRQAEVLTVIWTLTIMATLGAELLLLIAGTLLLLFKQQPQEGADEAVKQAVHPFAMIPGVLMFIAALTGLICLLLTPLVYRFREVAPPRVITAVAILASIVPLATAIASVLSR